MKTTGLFGAGATRCSTLAAVALPLALAGQAEAYTHTIVHSFCASQNCLDGQAPNGVIADSSGALYGVGEIGGKYGPDGGVLFKLLPNADHTKWKELVIHSFCKAGGNTCPDGREPSSPPIIDVNGNLYGTTPVGGKFDAGIVYKAAHTSNGWTLEVLHVFCQKANCVDGGSPGPLHYAGQSSGAPWDGTSPLLGATEIGGKYSTIASNGDGLVFQLTPSGSRWDYSAIHQFQSGAAPSDILADAAGNIFGSTTLGGEHANGFLYKLAAGTWQETTLHQFCALANCADGGAPGAPLEDGSGNLFGADVGGGPNAQGAIFEYSVGGQYSLIYSFCSLANCADGAWPTQDLLLDGSGNLFGSAMHYGPNGPNSGTAFELSPAGGTWSLSTLYAFCAKTSCTDGKFPLGSPFFMDGAGNLFGATNGGGANQGGTIYELKP